MADGTIPVGGAIRFTIEAEPPGARFTNTAMEVDRSKLDLAFNPDGVSGRLFGLAEVIDSLVRATALNSLGAQIEGTALVTVTTLPEPVATALRIVFVAA
jgi:hypothetical protein